ncbi:PAS domain S-box protein [Maridesulfovibrio sp.]|uniref:PAS domain S-box protein n=2 Tax=Maridesulfovibrio TaxID=2794998 RepID=UPI003B009885
MWKNKLNFIILASIMATLTLLVSGIQSYMLYQTFLTEQRNRLNDLVVSQASLAKEFINYHSPDAKRDKDTLNLEYALNHLANAQQKFTVNSNSGEFTMAVKNNNLINFLVVNGQRVKNESPLNKITFGDPRALPMQKALEGDSGTIIGLDYEGQKVLAAYTCVSGAGLKLGMVAKIDLVDIQKPFIIVSIEIFAIGILLFAISITVLHFFSDPFFKKMEKSKHEYRELVENANSLIIRVNEKGLISFANSFATTILAQENSGLIGEPLLAILSGDLKPDTGETPSIHSAIRFFGPDGGPYERPCIKEGNIVWLAWRIRTTHNPDGTPKSLLCIGNDITAKYNALEKLKESESRYRNIFENAPLAMVYFKNNGEISDCNDTFLDLMGAPRNKIIGFNTAEKSYPDMQNALKKSIHGRFSSFEGVYTSITGQKTTYLRAVFNPVKSHEPPYEVIATLEDISARKTVEHELAESERRFKGIAKASPVGIMITDTHGEIQYVNKRMVKICESTREELMSESWTKKIHPEDQTELENNWYKTVPALSNKAEFRIIRKNGQPRWVLGQLVELEDNHTMTGYVITITDITNVKEAQQEHRRLSTAIHQAAEAIIITDTSGIIEYVNPAFERITGYSAAEAIGMNPSILKSGEHDDYFYTEMWVKITQGKTWTGRFINHTKSGKRYTQEATITPVKNENGQIVSFVGVAKDISQQLMVEAQLRQAQKLESIGELAAGIAHEINTPTQYVTTNIKFLDESFGELIENLNKIKNIRSNLNNSSIEELAADLNQMIDDDNISYLAEDIPNAINESEEGLRRISEIVKSVRQLAHPGETRKGYYSLNEIINDAVTVSANEWKYIADIELDLEPDLPEIPCLKGEMGQVVLNLIVNSAHAIEEKKQQDKGTIAISTFLEEDSVVLKIKDNGCGMSQSVIERAFDPFFTTKQVGKGTGQGLAITHNVIVTAHSGSIQIDSKEGEGTTLTIKLPT